MAADLIRRRLVVHGQVQGVFYRDSTREQAESAGVAGWAHNRDDGAVEVVLEGPSQAVHEVVQFCQSGPRGAQVDSIDSTEEEPEGLSSFEIR
ncbi:MAG TPA: acylphosphatase [Solirubrobacteraceae bacterium]